MPSITVTTEDGKNVVVVGHNVTYVEAVPGEPGEPAIVAQDEVPDDPGEPANMALGNPGRTPTKGHPKVEAKAAKAGKPDKAIVHLVGGDTLTVVTSANTLREALG
jgi:hypothetical protein